MVSELPPDCPALLDGCIQTHVLDGMDKDRFYSLFLDGVQIHCASGAKCNIHPGASPVDESPHRCMNCALKFHSCITCGGSPFGDWLCLPINEGFSCQMLSLYGQERFAAYKDDLLSPLEISFYCQDNLCLNIEASVARAETACGENPVNNGSLPTAELHYKANK